MTIEKLARFIVDDYFNGAPNEQYTIAVEREIRKMKEQIQFQSQDIKVTQVYVEID